MKVSNFKEDALLLKRKNITEKKKIIRKNLSHWPKFMHGESMDTPIFVFTPLYQIQMYFIAKAIIINYY